jgi:hypothetical protein
VYNVPAASTFNYGQVLATKVQQVQVPQILNVERAIPTLTVSSSNANNVWGEAVSWTASISITTGFVPGGLANVIPGGQPAGTLNFFLNGVAIAGCSAAVPQYNVQNIFNSNCAQTGATLTPALPPGANIITVNYVPTDATIIAPVSFVFTQNTNKDPTSIVLTSDVNPALTGSTLTLTALLTVSAAPGSQNGEVANSFTPLLAPAGVTTAVEMSFFNGGAAITNCQNLPITRIGTTNQYYSTCIVTAAAGSMTAVYPNTHLYIAGSTSNTVSQAVNAAIAVVTLTSNVLAPIPNTFGNGASITYTAVVDVVGGPAPSLLTGTVAFTDSVPAVGTAMGSCAAVAIVPTSSSSGVATCTAQIYRRGTSAHVVSATFTGTPNNAVGTLAVTVSPGAIIMTTSSDPLNTNTVVHAQPIRLIAYVQVSQAANAPVAALFPVAGYVAFYTGTAATAPLVGSYTNLVPGCSGVAVQAATSSLPCLPSNTNCVIAVCTTSVYSFGTDPIFYSIFSATNTGSGITTAGDYNDAVSATGGYQITIKRASTNILTVVGPNPAVVGQPITIQSIVNVLSPSVGIPVPTTAVGASEVRMYYGSDNIIPVCGSATPGNGKQLFIPGTLTTSCSNALFSPGQFDIKSQYPGDTNYFSSGVSAPVTLTVLKGNTSLTMTSDRNPAIQNPTITANTVVLRVSVAIAAPAAGSLGGEVIFRITNGPTTPYQGFPINSVSTNIVYCAGQNVNTGGVSFASGLGSRNTATCITPLTGALGVLPLGSLTITATYTGDVNFNGNSTTITQVVQAALSQTSLATSVTPAVTGQTITYTATVQKNTNSLLSSLFTASTITGNVAFLDGSNTILNCDAQPVSVSVANSLWFIAQCTTAFPRATNRNITAVFTSTTTGLASSVSPVLIQPVNQANTTTVVTGTPNPSAGGSSVALTATVSVNLPGYSTSNGAISGTVAFYSAGVNVCNATGLVNPVTVTLSATCSSVFVYPLAGQTVVYLTAVYSGDSNFLSSTSVLYTQVVSKAPTAVAIAALTAAVPVTSGVTGQTLNFTATISSTQGGVPTGSFTISYAPVVNGVVGAAVVMCPTGNKLLLNAVGWCQVQPATATSGTFSGTTFTPGTYRIQVNYTGDYIYAASTNFVDFVIAKAPTQLAISGNNGLYDIGVDAINAVAFKATLTTTALGLGSTTPQGPWSAIVNYPTGPVTFRVSSGAGTATVIPACAALLIAGAGNIPPFETTGCNMPAPVAGIYTLTATYAGDANFLGSTISLTPITIYAGSSTLTCPTGAVANILVGQIYTPTATVVVSTAGVSAPAAGTIRFTVTAPGSTAVTLCTTSAISATGVGSCSTPLGAFFPVAGTTYTIGGIFTPAAGTSSVGASTCSGAAWTIIPAAGTLSLAVSVSPSTVVYGQYFTATAVVSVNAPAGGTPVGTLKFVLPLATAATPGDWRNWCLAQNTVICNSVAVSATANTYTCTVSASNRGVRPGVVPADVGFGQASDTAMCDLTTLGTQSTIGVQWTGTGATAGSYTYTPSTTYPPAVNDQAVLRIIKAPTTVALTSAAPIAPVSPTSAATPLLTAVVSVLAPGGDVFLKIQQVPAGFTALMDFRYQQITPAIANPPINTFASGTVTNPVAPTTSTSMQVTLGSYNTVLGNGIVGSYNQRVSFLGDIYLAPSVSPWILQTIVSGTTSTGVLPNANPSVIGQQVTYIATVTILTGTGKLDSPAANVTFYDGANVICAASPVTQVSLTQGTATCLQTYTTISTRTGIKATYNGNSNYAGSISPLVSQVSTFAQTTTVVQVAVGVVSATSGISVAVTANAPGAGTPTGYFTAYEGTTVIPGCVNVRITSNCSRVYTSRTTVPVTAVYSGDTLFATSTSAINSFTPVAAATNVTVTSSLNPAIVSITPVTFVATVTVLAPAVIGGVGITGVVPTGTVSFNVGDSSCQNRGLALNTLVSPTTYQATCTTVFTSAGVTTVTATYTTASTDTTAGSSGSIAQTTVVGTITTVIPTSTSNTTRPATTVPGNATTTSQANATSTAPLTTGQLYLVIINFQYCINAAQWAQYRQNLANFLRVSLSVVQVVTDPTLTCAAAKRQSSFRSTAVVGFSDLALAQAAVNGINGGQVQSIPGFPDPTAVLASGATNGGGLSGGQIAGIVVGSVLGFFLIVALIVIAFILGKKQGGGSEMSGRA